MLDILQNNNFQAFIVGGCVRDSILGKLPNDWDICTDATPEKILQCFKQFKTIHSGQKHGTIGIIVNNTVYEITTFRIDSDYLDLRHPSRVFFTDSLKNDLSRRDFTINAMAYNEKDGLKDFFGGMDDINKQNIKCVGEPHKRF
jgi:tRNA nucleotidyltransferase (CCA-adding enzyme)